jgi:fibronectin-binding autotransporter adhesin
MKTSYWSTGTIVRLSALLSVAFFFGTLAHAQSTWSGGGADQNWSTPGNWSGGVVPNNNAVTFPDGVFPVTTNVQGVINNIVQSSTAISSLTYNNLNGDFDTTQIPAGVTLTVNGNLSVGINDGVAANRTAVTMTGGGSLVAGSGASTFSGQSGTGNAVSILDLSGLSSFVFNPAGTGGTFSLGPGSSGSAMTMTLAAVSNAITVGTFSIGANNTRGNNIVILGSGTNIIYADTINMGFSKTAGTLQSTNGGGLTIANRAGTGRSTINISGESSSGSTTANNNAFMLLNDAPVKITAGTITIGNRQARAGGTATGVLTFNNGIVDANAINMAINLGGGGAANGTVAVGNTGVLKVGGSISLVNQAGTAGAGTLIVTNGGTVICSNNIFKTTSIGVGTVDIATGTLVLGGTLGVSNGIPVDNFGITNATLTLSAVGVGQPAVAVVNFAPDFLTTSNIINIASLPSISSYPTQLPLISYSAPAGNLDTMVLGTLPAGFSGYVSNNTSASSIDLVLTNGPAAKADTWRGTVNSLWDTTTLNWLSSDLQVNYLDLDQVTFDDSAATGLVTITGTRMPATVNGLTFNNNSLNYVFSGSGKITGPVQLVMNGTGSVTLSETGGDNFSGGVSVNAGTLILDNTNAAISGGLFIGGGATVQIGNNDGVGGLPAGTIENEGTLIFNRTNNLSIGSVIPGGGALVQNGSGILTLTAHETYTGNTTVGTGTLALTGNGSLASSAQVTVTNGTLDVSGITAPTTLATLNITNSALNVKVGYLQTNLSVSALNMGGTSNLINVVSLPPIAHYPATNILLQSAGSISGYNFVLGSLPVGTPSYVGTIALSPDGMSVVLSLTAGPIATRPSVTWNGSDALAGISTNWSDALNWQTPGVPAPTEPVLFNNTATGGGTPFDVIGDGTAGVPNPQNIDNIVDINITNAALTYGNSGGTFHNTQIAPGKTLTVNGSFAVNGAGGNVTILGVDGTLKVNNPSNSTTLNVQNNNAATLDMSGLSTFAGSINQIGVGFNTANNAATVNGAWYMARTNTITTGSGFSGVGAALVVGGGVQSSGQLFLGKSNALYVDGITLGVNTSGNDLIAFNPAWQNPVAYIRGTLGDASRVTLWSLGDATINLNNTTPNGNLTNDFTFGVLDAMVNTLVVGQGSQGNTAPSVPFKGLFIMEAGRLDVTTLKIGTAGGGNAGGIGVGIMNVFGGTVIANTVALPASTFASGPGVLGTTGALSVTNATLIVSNSITVAANSGGGTLNAVNSTVKLLNGAVGSPTTPLTTLTLDGGSLQLPVDVNAGTAVVTATTVNTNNPTTINIGSITNVVGQIQAPLISYVGTDPFGALVLGTYPAGYTVALVDNTGNSSVDLSITPTSVPGPTTNATITSVTLSGTNLLVHGTNNNIPNNTLRYVVLTSTNLLTPLSNWTRVSTNPYTQQGTFDFSSPVVPGVPQQFIDVQAVQ